MKDLEPRDETRVHFVIFLCVLTLTLVNLKFQSWLELKEYIINLI